MYKALIVDDHPFIRSTVRLLLADAGIKVVGEADNGVQAVHLARTLAPDLIVLDIALPRLDGLNVIRRLSLLGLRSRILVLTSQTGQIYSPRCQRAGAHGYLSKSEEMSELGKACWTLLAGGLHFSQAALDAEPVLAPTFCEVVETSAPIDTEATEGAEPAGVCDEKQQLSVLSNREVIVLYELAMGRTNKEIGDQLIISAKTVSTYKSRLLKKLHMRSVVQLAAFAKRTQLI